MTDIVRAGWATKRGNINKNWRRRYFVLKKDSTLTYYKTQDFLQTKPRGVIDITKAIDFHDPNACDALVPWPKTAAVNARFEIQLPGRTYHIFCDTPQDCDEWLSKMRQLTGREDEHPHTTSTTAQAASRKPSRSEQQQQKLHKELKDLVSLDDNKCCFDCGRDGPTWASWNLGVFICLACAGLHRSLGPRISNVKNINLDTWSQSQVDNLRKIGNKNARELYLCRAPEDLQPPMNDIEQAEQFLRDKYVDRKYGEAIESEDSSSDSSDDNNDDDDEDDHVTTTMNIEASNLNATTDPMAQHRWTD
ncbi:hypothetical protein PTSG_09616 [Salpingoeca rosetta]|uniref:Uncharacterized protein n=1 Tax=Salpingoeca rosetta (strain ATCC 50818 / BSB-021) TaxID=946362 RepID=F2ULI3_SALR5|nr:uncharacterized protein PTSG_09616 [Salpingoeca rosetta]EGD77982.1 hypothetical protein PTSG_09616 [Salpingoeca rosetta]|eukprot:XP_004990044.1 hypothetical protein PTSG_09616 [Salpingoeca rosetta]